MLKQMREGAKSTVLKVTLFGLLLLAMAGLALMDVQGMFRSGMKSNVIFSYSKGKLTTMEFDRLVQSTLRNQNIKQSDAYRADMPRQLLKQEIDNRLFSMAAYDAGLQVDDVLAAKQVKEMLKPLVEKGMTEKDALQRLLQAYSLSEGQLVNMLKTEIASQRLRNTILMGAHAPQQLVNDMLRHRYEWRRGEYFRLTAADLGAVKEPAEAELRSYYDSIAHDYALPEYRTLSVIVLNKKSLGEDGKITEEKLRRHYDENIADYRSAETRVVAQLVAVDETSAKLAYDAAEKTKDLQKAAEATGKGKTSYIKPGTFTEKEMPVELSKAAFSGKAGTVLPPVKSPLGWHILHIEKVTPAVTKPFEMVKASIQKDIEQDKISELLYALANRVDDEIAGGKSVSEVAKENNIQAITLEKIDARGLGRDGKKPGVSLPLFDKVVENGFALKQGSASPLIETPEGDFVIVGTKEVFAPEQQAFDKMRPTVLSRWQSDQQAKALSARTATLTERLKNGESFEKLAGEFSKAVQSTELVQRGALVAKLKLEENVMSALFSLDKVGASTTVRGDSAVTVIRLADRKVQSPSAFEKEKVTEADNALRRSLQEDLLEQYRIHLIAKYDVSVNDKLLSEMYTPKDDDGGDAEE